MVFCKLNEKRKWYKALQFEPEANLENEWFRKRHTIFIKIGTRLFHVLDADQTGKLKFNRLLEDRRHHKHQNKRDPSPQKFTC